MIERQEFSYPQFQEVDKPRHGCGVVGIYHPNAEILSTLYQSLISLQNRGQESSGVAILNDRGLQVLKDKGLVLQVYGWQGERLSLLETGQIAIGHNRYGTTGDPEKILQNAQPIIVESNLGQMTLSHNGNLVNSLELRRELEEKEEIFLSTSDSEVIAKLIATSEGQTWQEKIKNAAKKLNGAYSLTMIAGGNLIGVRDPLGFWPLVLGRYNEDGYMLASESGAFNFTGVEFIREVEPGEIITIGKDGLRSDFITRGKSAFCMFEFYYFSQESTIHKDFPVEQARFNMGIGLWEEHPVQADWIIPVPETARPAAEGFSYASGIPNRSLLPKNRSLFRIFIQPDQRIRELEIRLKHTPLAYELRGKRIVLIDDSIVRGTTTGRIIRLLKEKAGVKEVHMRITAPPITDPCFFGVDTATRWELAAAQYSIEEIRENIGADSLGFLSLERGLKAIAGALWEELYKKLCTACFTGKYPLKVPQERDKLVLERI